MWNVFELNDGMWVFLYCGASGHSCQRRMSIAPYGEAVDTHAHQPVKQRTPAK
jgi:hypothetical protein